MEDNNAQRLALLKKAILMTAEMAVIEAEKNVQAALRLAALRKKH
jgi:hypothetical protein